MDIKVGEYNAKSIESYENLMAVRERPTMYIEELGTRGIFRLINECKDNCDDEFKAGRASTMWVRIDEVQNEICIEDDGAGIPIEKALDCVSKLHTGGKFKSKAYTFRNGQNGVGLKTVTALSNVATVEVLRDNKKFIAIFEKGVLKHTKTKDHPSKRTGTKITFVPDETIFGKFSLKYQSFVDYLRKFAYISAGFNVILEYKHKGGKVSEEKFRSDIGIKEYLEKFVLAGKRTIIPTPIYIKEFIDVVEGTSGKDAVHIGLEAVFTWVPNSRSVNVLSFVNGIQTSNDGTHVSGFTKGICAVMRKDFQEGIFLSKKDPLLKFVNREDFLEGFTAILVSKHEKPLFDGQTKNRLSSSDYEEFAARYTEAKFREWCNLNKAKYKSIIDLVIVSAKARYAAYNARNAIKTVSAASTYALSGIANFSPNHSKDPSESELFIVEGDSAGGSAKTCRDAKTQAIYKAFGVPTNVYAMSNISKILKNDVRNSIKDIVMILSCGLGDAFDYEKLRYGKIIVMADADTDGAHITSLYLGFLFRCFKPLIDNGHVFIANPPLFKITSKGKSVYVANMQEYDAMCDNAIFKEFELCAYDLKKKKVKPVKDNFYKTYLYLLRGYAALVNGIASHLKMNPYLIEKVIINWDNLLKYKAFRIDGWDFIPVKMKNGTVYLEGIYQDVYHRISLSDNSFISSIRPIAERLKEIQYYNLTLRHRKMKTYMGFTPYEIASKIAELLTDSVTKKRFKGLGEMNPSQLWETTMNPKTRILTRVSTDDIEDEKVTKILDILIGNDLQGRKNYYREVLGSS